ncbi:polysaccharide biosynthesis protein [bacterium BMS3Bbin12]|nr:polysaccharide biosynthesis protein [bacterium BMS3Bbin12]GBE51168.1 polysaccharide biosynthesis protein [bacterium BMS3Bbin13]
MPETAPSTSGRGTPLARGVLVNAFGILVKVSRTGYLILFSRLIGADGFGIYLLAFTLQELAGKIGILGLHWGGGQAVGALLAKGEGGAIRGVMWRILAVAMLGSVAAAVGLYFLAPTLANLLGHPAVAAPLRVFAAAIPFMNGTYVLVYSFRPRLNMKYEMYITSVIEPVTVLAAGAVLLTWRRRVEMAALAHVIAAAVAFGAAAVVFQWVYPRADARRGGRVDRALLVHGSFTMGVMDLFGNLKTRIDLLILARFLPVDMVGVYGAVTEIAGVLRKSRSAFDPIIMPIAQRLYLKQDHAGLQRETTRAVGWALQIGLGLLGLVLLVPERLLGLFGADFTGPVFTQVLMILAAGQFVNMSFGLGDGILAITGYGYVGLRSTLAMICADVVLLVLLIPHWGLLGAAFATSVTTVTVVLWRAARARRLLGLRLFVRAHLPVPLSWVLGLAAGFGILAGVGRGVFGDALALSGFGLIFFGLLHARGWLRGLVVPPG